MPEEPKTVVVLSNRINEDGTLQEDVRGRVDLAVELYNGTKIPTMTMSGKQDPRDLHFHITHAEAMKRYAIQHGVPDEAVLKEEESLDTVGQAYFVKRNIVVPRNWESFLVVTSGYHLGRARHVFDFIFGPEFQINYQGSATDFDIPMWVEEFRRLERSTEFFHGIRAGDDDAISYKLFTEHPLYRK